MKPMLSRLLGAFAPNTLRGTMVGAATAQAAALMNARREGRGMVGVDPLWVGQSGRCDSNIVTVFSEVNLADMVSPRGLDASRGYTADWIATMRDATGIAVVALLGLLAVLI